MKSKSFYSHGKLLISGEYVVLDGANALALPTTFGQSLIIEPFENNSLSWESFDDQGTVWFKADFEFTKHAFKSLTLNDTSLRLEHILNACKSLNPDFLSNQQGFKVKTLLDFPTHWGLGTSSTLINNISQWAQVNPYKLLSKTFGGSGYDIACAQHNTAISYSLNNSSPKVSTVNFNPSFKNHLYFIYLNKKQDSRAGIKYYHNNKKNIHTAIAQINEITLNMIQAKTLSQFETLVTQHEFLIGSITNQTPVKSILFNDFKGAIKSLGAWGGDFILATSKENPTDYFISKGYNTIIPYQTMIL